MLAINVLGYFYLEHTVCGEKETRLKKENLDFLQIYKYDTY